MSAPAAATASLADVAPDSAVAGAFVADQHHHLPSLPEPRTVRIALAGCGVVGSALVRLLHFSAATISARHGVRLEIVRVLVRDAGRSREVPLGAGIFTDDLAAFLAEDVDVVVEAIGGREHAEEIARAALGRGKRLVTANKELVAAVGASLAALARSSGATLDFGAAVGGSVPVISTLRDLLGASPPASVRGILNGTSNYILSLLERGGDYEDALAAACRCGLAEADCSRDMDGSDTAAKLAIIAWVCFGTEPSTLPVRRIGLLPDPARFVRHAAAVGGRVRLVAECARVGEREIAASVEPVIVPLESALARTEREDNRVEVDLGWPGPLAVSGPGAGGAPTASSLLSDLLTPSRSPHAHATAASGYVAVDDPRAHCWLVAAGASASTLVRALRRSGIHLQAARADAEDPHVITLPTSWASLQPFLAELQGMGARPLVARVELPPPEPRLS